MPLPLVTCFLMVQVCDLSGGAEMVRKREKTVPKVTSEQPNPHICLLSLLTQRMHTDSLKGETELAPTSWCSNWLNVALSCTYLSSVDQPTGQCTLWAGNMASTFPFLFSPSAALPCGCFSSIPAPVLYPVILSGMLAELKHKTPKPLILSCD